eukprot:scaffold18319_cov16-Tisochrysis_lutea.AAC.2
MPDFSPIVNCLPISFLCAYHEFPGSVTMTLAVTWAQHEVDSTQCGSAGQEETVALSKACTDGQSTTSSVCPATGGALRAFCLAICHPHLVRVRPAFDKGPFLAFSIRTLYCEPECSSACT